MDAMPDEIRFRTVVRDAVLVVRFDHLRTRNALDRSTRARLVEVLREADEAEDIRVVVLTGSDPAFTSGVDAKQLLGEAGYAPLPTDPATAVRSMATPTIAAVNGSCVSGGLEIALACSIIVASERASFADTHARLGLTPGWGLSVELPAAVGAWRARQLALTGLPIDAKTAYEWGLIGEVVAHDALDDRVRELAHAIATIDPPSVRNANLLYREGQDAVHRPAREVERTVHSAWSVDRSAARASFAQRVSPPST